MSFMEWNPHLATGVAVIDEQHRWLIDLVNSSAPLLARNQPDMHERTGQLLDELVDYATYHFATEDRLIREYRIDPRHDRHHQACHGRLASEVVRFRDALQSGDCPAGSALLSFLAHWLIYHILGEDQALARQIQAIEQGCSPAEAYDRFGSTTEPTNEALTLALLDAYTRLVTQNGELDEKNRELELHRGQLERLVSERTATLVHALDAAEAANKAKSAFIANMSHEIRTPMNAIVGISWALKQNTHDPLQLARLDQIGKASHQLLTIINDLLDLARIESDRLQLEPLDFEPAKVLREIHRSIADQAAARELRLDLEVIDLPSMVRGDPVRLEQILANYASNALKFTERGFIAIRARRLPDIQGQLRLRFEVEDSGIGIAAETLPRLFAPFEQVDASSTRQYGGTGLGLALARRLAEMMGGTTGVDSTLGRGSLFWLELPFSAAATAAGTVPDAPTVKNDAATPCLAPEVIAGRERELLRCIASLLANDDVEGARLWREDAATLAPLLGERQRPFESALASYDFAAAHAILDGVIDAADNAFPEEPAAAG